MKNIVVILCCTAILSLGASRKQGGLSSITIYDDTVRSNDTAYCLLVKRKDVLVIRTLQPESIVYLQPVQRNGQKWYRIAFSPLNRVYYTQYNKQFVTSFLHLFTRHQVIADGHFNAYGANMLIQEAKDREQWYEEWEIPVLTEKPVAKDWHISWKATTVADSMIILKNGIPFAYYIKRHWKDYGVDSWRLAATDKVTYRYFIYQLNHKPMAEVRVWDGWQTEVNILTPDGEQYQVRNVPADKDYLTVVVKLLLLKQGE